jgi:hypothetical protein
MSYLLDIECAYKLKRVNKRIYSSRNNIKYVFMNYDKNYLCFDDVKSRIYRSLIYSFPENELICFSPPKTVPINLFIKMHPDITSNNITVTESIEGIMINLFYDKRINKWEIATRNAIGGNYWFYGNQEEKSESKTKSNSNSNSKSTFYDMFLDVFQSSPGKELNDIVFLEELPKWASYTFILQHPNNNILIPIERPHLYLVAVYSISIERAEYIPCQLYENWRIFQNMNNIIEFPKTYEPTLYSDLFELSNTDDCKISNGFIIKNEYTGEMTKVISTEYENLKKLIKTEPLFQYQYFCLNRIGRVFNYLNLFPSHKKKFYDIKDTYENFINIIYQYYIGKYICKKDMVIPDKYSTHIYKIHHEIYLPMIINRYKSNSKRNYKITRKIVSSYFNNMEPRELMFILNWDRRENIL